MKREKIYCKCTHHKNKKGRHVFLLFDQSKDFCENIEVAEKNN